MIKKLKKNIGVIVILLVFASIATCNVRMRNNAKEDIINNPQVGNYFVFDDYPTEGSQIILKIKEVRTNDILFYLPEMKTIGDFKLDKTESVVRKMDASGKMFGSRTISIDNNDLEQMVKNDGFSGHMGHKPRVIAVFK